MKKIFLIFLFSVCLFQSFAKKNQTVPDWVLNYETVFPNSKYIAQKGTGKSADEAQNNAAANISFYFNTNVNAVKETNFKSYENSNGKKTKQVIEQSVVRGTLVDSKTSLSAVEFTEPWKNKKDKVWHCVAFIERETLWNKYEPELRVAKDNFKSFYDNAEKSSEPFEKIRMIGLAYENGKDFLDKISYAQFLSEKLTDQNYKEDIFLLSQLNSIEQDLKNKTPFFVQVSNDLGNTIYSTISQILSEDGFSILKDKNRAVYVVNVDLGLDNQKSDELFIYYPSVTIDFTGRNGNIYVYSKECGNVKVYTQSAGVKKCIQNINEELKTNFKSDLDSALGGI